MASGGFLAITADTQDGPFDVWAKILAFHPRCFLYGGAVFGGRHLVRVWTVQPGPDMRLLDAATYRPGQGRLPASNLHSEVEVFDAHAFRI